MNQPRVVNEPRVVLPADLYARIDQEMRRHSPDEHGIFLTCSIGTGVSSTRIIARDIITVDDDPFDRRAAHTLAPSGRHLSAAAGAADADDRALLFIHSHPDADHPPTLSPIDERTTSTWATTFVPWLGKPLTSLVWSPHGVNGIVYGTDMQRRTATVEVVGNRRRMLLSTPTAVPAPVTDALDDRQRRALGDLGNTTLRGMRVAVIGAGGTGSWLCEMLARAGVRDLLIVDHDDLDTPSNLRRVLGASRPDLDARRNKAQIAADNINRLGLGTHARALPHDVRENLSLASLIDADVIVNTTDTHSSRAHVNQLAQQYGLPLIDVGAAVGISGTGVTGMPAEVRIVMPDGPCLWCMNALSSDRIRLENLPEAERRGAADEGYGADVDAPVPSLVALNAFAASLAGLAVVRLHSSTGTPGTRAVLDGWEWYIHELPNADCSLCSTWRWAGETGSLPTRSM
jgi:molybdopterin/thiamine biosynthesis adenylyltransferase